MHYGHPPSSPFHYHTLLTDEMYNTLMGYTLISKVAPSTSPLPPPSSTGDEVDRAVGGADDPGDQQTLVQTSPPDAV